MIGPGGVRAGLLIVLLLSIGGAARAGEIQTFQAMAAAEGGPCPDDVPGALARALAESGAALVIELAVGDGIGYRISAKTDAARMPASARDAWATLGQSTWACGNKETGAELAGLALAMRESSLPAAAKHLEDFLNAPRPFTTLDPEQAATSGRLKFCLAADRGQCTREIPPTEVTGAGADATLVAAPRVDDPAPAAAESTAAENPAKLGQPGAASPPQGTDLPPKGDQSGDGAPAETEPAAPSTEPAAGGAGATDFWWSFVLGLGAGLALAGLGLWRLARRLARRLAGIEVTLARLDDQVQAAASDRAALAGLARQTRKVRRMIWLVARRQKRQAGPGPAVGDPVPSGRETTAVVRPGQGGPLDEAGAEAVLADYNTLVVQGADPDAFRARYRVAPWGREKGDRQPVYRSNVSPTPPGRQPDIWLVRSADQPGVFLVLPAPDIWRDASYMHMDGGAFVASDFGALYEIRREGGLALASPARVTVNTGQQMDIVERGRITVG